MSLFQAREWWTIKPDEEEETGQGNLLVSNIDNADDGNVKIVTASYSGFLRIYYPRQAGYKIDDLMLEKNLDLPILQIAAGKFIPSSNKLGLCVLHPRKVAVYNVQAVKGQGSTDTSYYQLTLAFEHKLDRTAFNFCYGPFGGVVDKDYICVQSMDGQLQVFEQGSFAFSRYLNNFLVPGPFCYVAKIDSFVTVNSAMGVECYKFQVLSAASENKGDEKDDQYGLNASKKVHSDWQLNIGEHAVDMFVARFSHTLGPKQGDIVVVGEHTLFTIKEGGTIRMQKRLDFNPSYAHAFDDGSGGENGFQNLLVGTYQNSLMVYKDSRLVWAARTLETPIGLAVGAFGGIKGFIVMMTDTCEVTVSYLGTDPPVQGTSAADNKELDYEAMDEEHRNLLKVIRQASTDTLTEPTEKLTLRVQVPTSLSAGLDRSVYEDSSDHAKEDGQFLSVVVKLFVSYSGKEDLEDINISILSPKAFIPEKSSIILPSLRGGGSRTPIAIDIRFRVSSTLIPSSLNVDVLAAFVTRKNEPRTAQTQFRLPMCLACKIVSPLKNCQYMFTLDTNRSPPALTDLFEDILAPAMATNADVKRTASNVMTVVYHGQGVDVTILVSKKSGRYRLQSGCFEALALVSEEVVERLQATFKTSDFVISFKELLPLHDYFVIIDKHHEQRLRLSELRTKLENQAHQYRVIQKRLLVRFKDKNPAPLAGLDVLHHDTYNALIDLGNGMASVQAELAMSGNMVACATQLMLLLITFKHNLGEADTACLRSHLSSFVNDSDDQGWEERTDAAMTHLLRTSLAKNARDAANVAQPLVALKDTSKLKRHIQIVCDRLGKGLRLTEEGNSALKSRSPSNKKKKEETPPPPAAETAAEAEEEAA